MDTQFIIVALNGVLGLANIGLGTWLKFHASTMKRLEQDLTNLRVHAAETFVPKTSFEDRFEKLESKIDHGFNRVMDKLDTKADKSNP